MDDCEVEFMNPDESLQNSLVVMTVQEQEQDDGTEKVQVILEESENDEAEQKERDEEDAHCDELGVANEVKDVIPKETNQRDLLRDHLELTFKYKSMLDQKIAAEDDLDELKRILEDTKEKLEELTSQVDSLRGENERLKTENNNLKSQLQNLEPGRENLRTPKDHLKTLKETDNVKENELDEFEPTPSRSFPRQSIGQWSMERKKRNLSVKSLVSSLEAQRR